MANASEIMLTLNALRTFMVAPSWERSRILPLRCVPVFASHSWPRSAPGVIAALFVLAAVRRRPKAGGRRPGRRPSHRRGGESDRGGLQHARVLGDAYTESSQSASQRTAVWRVRGVEMSVVPRKVIRQKLMQTAVLDKIEREHLPVDTDQVRQSLDRIREQIRGKSLLEHVGRWDELLRTGDLDLIRNVVLSDDEVGREMRNLSPLTVLLTESERLEVLDNVRRRAA